MSMNELNQVGRDLLAVRAMISELESEAEALTDQIKAAMVERGEEVIACPSWKKKKKNVTSSRFDSKAFKAAQPDVYNAFTRTTTTCRFTISPTAA